MSERDWLLTADNEEVAQAFNETDNSIGDMIAEMKAIVEDDTIPIMQRSLHLWAWANGALDEAYVWHEEVTDCMDGAKAASEVIDAENAAGIKGDSL